VHSSLPQSLLISGAGNPLLFLTNHILGVLCPTVINDCLCAVETCDAGDGCLEVEIKAPSGRAIPHTVTAMGPSVANVTFIATECGLHHACITFNGESIPGMINPLTPTVAICVQL